MLRDPTRTTEVGLVRAGAGSSADVGLMMRSLRATASRKWDRPVGGNGIMKSTQIEDEKIVLNGFLRIPPTYLLSLCQTSDQKQHWDIIYQSRQVLRKGLEAYFGGTELSLDQVECQKTRKWAKHWIDGWTDLYDCIRAGWGKLSSRSKGGATSPGELFVALLEEESEVGFKSCTRYMYLSPRELGNLHREWRKALNSQEARKIANSGKKIKAKSELWRMDNQDRLEKIEQQLKRISKRDKRVSKKFEIYKQSKSEEAKAVLSFTHPRQQLSIVKWERGVRYIS